MATKDPTKLIRITPEQHEKLLELQHRLKLRNQAAAIDVLFTLAGDFEDFEVQLVSSRAEKK